MSEPPRIGSIGWMDLTVDDADGVRDFYREVVGWEVDAFSMGDYDDYCMKPPGGEAIAGVCHRRGVNAGIPPAWIAYVTVDDIEGRVQRCVDLGGEVVTGPTGEPGKERTCIIRDPAGAVIALHQPAG